MPLRLPLIALLLLAGVVAADDFSQEDTVFLKDGKTRVGRVRYEDDDILVLRRGTKHTEIPQAEIADVDAVWRHLPDLLQRIASAPPPRRTRVTMSRSMPRWVPSTILSRHSSSTWATNWWRRACRRSCCRPPGGSPTSTIPAP